MKWKIQCPVCYEWFGPEASPWKVEVDRPKGAIYMRRLKQVLIESNGEGLCCSAGCALKLASAGVGQIHQD